MKDGLVEEFWDNGKLRKRYNLNKEGKKHGLEEVFFKKGQLRSSRNYKDGKPDGIHETYHDNGQ